MKDAEASEAGRSGGAVGPSAVLEQVRAERPVVHVIGNAVSAEVVANALLALGASPAMATALEEAPEVAAAAGALVINLGAPPSDRPVVVRESVAAATAAKRPWALDPVGAGGATHRTAWARSVVALGPALIRGNASEILALAAAGEASSKLRGVAAGDPVEAAEMAARQLVAGGVGAVLTSGPVDHVLGARRLARIAGGSPLMARVTGLGCALTAVAAAGLAVGAAPFDAARFGAVAFAEAGAVAQAQERVTGPGAFASAFFDALYALDGAAMDARAAIAEPAARA